MYIAYVYVHGSVSVHMCVLICWNKLCMCYFCELDQYACGLVLFHLRCIYMCIDVLVCTYVCIGILEYAYIHTYTYI